MARGPRSTAGFAAGKRGQQFQAIGRSRGGLTTKIHAAMDALGNPLRFELTAGQAHDSVMGLKAMDLTRKRVLADRAYDYESHPEPAPRARSAAGYPEQEEPSNPAQMG